MGAVGGAVVVVNAGAGTAACAGVGTDAGRCGRTGMRGGDTTLEGLFGMVGVRRARETMDDGVDAAAGRGVAGGADSMVELTALLSVL